MCFYSNTGLNRSYTNQSVAVTTNNSRGFNSCETRFHIANAFRYYNDKSDKLVWNRALLELALADAVYRIYYWYIECPIFNRVSINIHSRRILTLVIITRAHILSMLGKKPSSALAFNLHLHSTYIQFVRCKEIFRFSLARSILWMNKILEKHLKPSGKITQSILPTKTIFARSLSVCRTLFSALFFGTWAKESLSTSGITLNQRMEVFQWTTFSMALKKNFVLKLSLSPMDFKEKTSSSRSK